MHSITKLQSGLPVITAPIAGTEAVTILIMVGAGSRYEVQSERGVSHFLEHMFFKGGKKFTNTKEVSVAIDGVGGSFNAFTGKEYAGYYVKVAKEHMELGFDVLSDMLLHATFPQEEIEKERGVIIEEERMYQDTPMYRAGWDFEQLIYGQQPLGWDTIGTEEVIRSVNQADFQKHKDLLYTPDNTVITVAGGANEAEVTALAEQYFGALGGSKGRTFDPFSGYGSQKVFVRNKKTEQSHLVLGVPGLHHEHPDHFAQRLLRVILGGSMSSRMFLNIREAMGMCYYISTDTDAYLDAGALTTRAGVDQNRLEEAIKAIFHEYMVCAKDGITDEELHRSKEYMKGTIKLSLEDSEERAHYYGKQALLYPHVREIADFVANVESVTVQQVNNVASTLLTSEHMRLVVIGDNLNEATLEALIS